MGNLLIVKNNIVISTNILANKLKIEHKNVLKTIESNKSDFEYFGIMIEGKEKTKGRSFNVKYLNEEQFIFYITLSKNKKETVILKKKITKEFFRMRKQLLLLSTQKANQEWLEIRKKGKLTRLNETDVIKRYIEYAINQGSNTYLKNPNLAYSNITRMENKALFILEQKYPNIREMLDINQLDQIKQADSIVLKALNDGMIENMHYKDIYKLAKTRIELFVSLIGKSIVPNLEFKELQNDR